MPILFLTIPTFISRQTTSVQCIFGVSYHHQGWTGRRLRSTGRCHLPVTGPCWEWICSPGGFGAQSASQQFCQTREIKKYKTNSQQILPWAYRGGRDHTVFWLLINADSKSEVIVFTFIVVCIVSERKSQCLHGVVEVVDLAWRLPGRRIIQTGIVHVTNHTLKPGQHAGRWHGFVWVVAWKKKRWALCSSSQMMAACWEIWLQWCQYLRSHYTFLCTSCIQQH